MVLELGHLLACVLHAFFSFFCCSRRPARVPVCRLAWVTLAESQCETRLGKKWQISAEVGREVAMWAWHGMAWSDRSLNMTREGGEEKDKAEALLRVPRCHTAMLLCCHVDMLFTGIYLTTI